MSPSDDPPLPTSGTRRTVAKGAAAALIGAAVTHLAGEAKGQGPAKVLPTAEPGVSIGVAHTIAKLRTRRLGEPLVLVLGYHAINDGGGGLFFWDRTSSAPEDGGTVFGSQRSSIGRWLRLDL